MTMARHIGNRDDVTVQSEAGKQCAMAIMGIQGVRAEFQTTTGLLDRPDLAADAVPRFEHDHLDAGFAQMPRARQTRQPGTDHDDHARFPHPMDTAPVNATTSPV